ncbi:uncharacterized protein B0P05DRAFT_586991 [Gilbertella persicaria]|uniref:Transcription initiation factor IIF subunit alpha n=1 Tax=Rhizopus stolonifer TaxID=4846 RepID=A0A367KVT7_RHIST|nr:uncharacterized protein B0P05DRAFT_586991 [Gilbertella persicaria]KAI8079532.1 hypothetical protein B0P05DRAFT_586991 [Gilbertella persicaria]RCI06267.1 hypothetical protein CU098_011946 [Rhizopus stolonifer]
MSIYNTSRTIKGKNTAGRGTPMARTVRPGVGPQRMLQQHQLQQQQQQLQQQQQQDNSYNEFVLVSTSQRGKNHVMDFKSSKRIEPKEFARPVKLHRKETNYVPYRQYIQNLNAANAAAAAATAAATTNNTPNVADGNTKPGEELTETNATQHGPRTGADISLIAPMGGATHNKKMLFKKRTKQIFMAKEDTRELKEQEHRPWILEDYDGQNSFTGTLEGGQRSDYMFFVLTNNGFKVMPVERWYKFQPKRNFKTLSLEEAEEQIKKQQKRDGNRWMMLKRDNEQPEETPRNKFKIVDNEEKHAGSDDEANRQDSDMDDLDFDDVFQDDEEGAAEHEVEDEEVKDSKDRVKKEIKDYSIAGGQAEDISLDDMNKLTSEGKQMRKLVRDLEKNRAYESDEEEGDPYASSAEELETDNEEDENDSDKEKKSTPIPPKKKATALNKPTLPKKTPVKIKKEGMSKPIGRPGSPSIYMKKERDVSPSPLSPVRQQSPPQRPTPDPSAGKKRRADEPPSTEVNKQRKVTNEDELITEREVVETLRGKTMTTKEFLYNFRKRIRKNNRNRDIITQLLKKVAKSSRGTNDPSTRTLELKPEYQ